MIALPKIVSKHKRVGRGIGSRGAKSGRGMKGQKSRSGHKSKPGFEGGQTPIYMRLPKGRGTKQIYSSQVEKPVGVSLSQLKRFESGTLVSPSVLAKMGMIKGRTVLIKLVGGGTLDRSLTVRVHAATAGAKAAVEKAGGKVEIIG